MLRANRAKLEKAIFKAYQTVGNIPLSINNVKTNELSNELIPMYNRIEQRIDNQFYILEISDIVRAIDTGSIGEYGEFFKITEQIIVSWIKKKQDEKNNRFQGNYARPEIYEDKGTYVDQRIYPMGSAINFKTQYLIPGDWDKVDTKNLALAIKKGHTEAVQYARQCGVEIIQRQNNLSGFRL